MKIDKRRLFKIVIATLSIILLIFLQQFYFLSQNKRKVNDVVINQHSEQTLPRGINFAGELAPIGDYRINKALKSAIRELSDHKESTMLLFYRAREWFPILLPLLKKNNIPRDFIFLPLAESGLCYGTSKKAAKGFWQFLPVTADHYHLMINEEVDERLNTIKATAAACQYLNDAYGHFHNWTLSAAAFNLGVAGLEKEIKNQHGANFYWLELNAETRNYIMKIIALKTILGDPKRFGFPESFANILDEAAKSPLIVVKEIKVDSGDLKMTQLASKAKTDLLKFKQFNPWFLRDKISNAPRQSLFLLTPTRNYSPQDSILIGYSNE